MKTTHDSRMSGAVETFLRILRERRSRRFGLGMKMATGPMAYQSRHPGIPLSEEEEALLVFAAIAVPPAPTFRRQRWTWLRKPRQLVLTLPSSHGFRSSSDAMPVGSTSARRRHFA